MGNCITRVMHNIKEARILFPENQFSFSKIQQINETLIFCIHTVTNKDKFVTLGKDCVSCQLTNTANYWHAYGSISSHCRSV